MKNCRKKKEQKQVYEENKNKQGNNNTKKKKKCYINANEALDFQIRLVLIQSVQNSLARLTLDRPCSG